jgi:flagellar motor switch protein FliM
MEILFPHATLEPIRDLLLQMFMGEKFGRDSIWESHFSRELRSTHVNVDALLHEKEMFLGDVLNFRVGTTLLLDCAPNEEITIRCGGVPVMKGKMGKLGEKIAVRIIDQIKREEEA